MKFIFSWKKRFYSFAALTKYFFHSKKNFICSRHRLISSKYSAVVLTTTTDMKESEPRVFTEVLLPRRSGSSVRENESSLQFEVHYRDSLKSSLLTFLVNHSRIMLIMDYILDTYNFIMGRMFKDDGGIICPHSNESLSI